MKSLLNFLLKYHVFFLFLVLEAVSMTLIVRYNNFQRVNVLNSSNALAGSIYNQYNSVIEYFSLKKINEKLATENANLRNELLSILHTDLEESAQKMINNELYTSIPAKVINNSVNKQYNYLTLNKGSKHGIHPDMGVICSQGVVGVVINVSNNYSTVLSVLNGRWSLNARLQSSKHFGPLKWEGQNAYIAILEEIPYHVNIFENEEVVTSGYSNIFPENIMIGRVVRTEHEQGAAFQNIWVQLSTDFQQLDFVEVIEKKRKAEQLELENTISNE